MLTPALPPIFLHLTWRRCGFELHHIPGSVCKVWINVKERKACNCFILCSNPNCFNSWWV
jgi:hypothetical protein